MIAHMVLWYTTGDIKKRVKRNKLKRVLEVNDYTSAITTPLLSDYISFFTYLRLWDSFHRHTLC